MAKKRKVCAVITARPSYSRIKTALDAINNHPHLELQLVLAASSILDTYGDITQIVKKDGLNINYYAHTVVAGQNLISMAKTCGLGTIELATVFDNLKPDVVITVADRYETMSTALAASYMNIPLIHIQGGEITGSIDEKVRHAITKLSDFHFVSNEAAKTRVIKMGENPEKVFNFGCPSIDIAKQALNTYKASHQKLNFDPITKYGGVGSPINFEKPYLVVMQHPVTTEYAAAKSQIIETLKAIHKNKIPTLWFWPNVDAGSDGTSRGIRSFREKQDISHIHFLKNVDPMDFLMLLIHSKGIIGNSSVAIRECSYLGVPAVNIGTRQQGRIRGKNVIDVNYNYEEIDAAINQILNSSRPTSDPIYGEGDAGNKIANCISQLELTFEKRLYY
jgi:UDP-hydrolysing UDP-N-acetyl-D-glucosamine 2-epimerase